MKRDNMTRFLSITLVLSMLFGSIGCSAPWRPSAWWAGLLDPTKTVARTDRTDVLPILPQVATVDEFHPVIPNAEPPTLEDLQWAIEEYVLGPGDIIDVSIVSLFTEGVESLLRRQVTEAGFIDLPLLPQRIEVGGMTVEQARRSIIEAYEPDILRDATVSIIVSAPRQNIFNVLGSVARPGTYPIIRREFRLLEALAMAGDQTERNIDYIYVIRMTPEARALGQAGVQPPPGAQTVEELPPLPGEEIAPPPVEPEDELRELEQFMPGGRPPAAPEAPAPAPAAPAPAVPQAPAPAPAAPAPAPTPAPVDEEEQARRELEQFLNPSRPEVEVMPAKPTLHRLTDVESFGGANAARNYTNGSGFVWVYRDDQWVRVPANQANQVDQTFRPATPPPAAQQALQQPAFQAPQPQPAANGDPAQPWVPPVLPPAAMQDIEGDPFGWATADLSHLARVIAIDLRRLKDGDPRMNIVVRDNDIVLVPALQVGEFYVMGEVARPGVYNLTGRKVTVKMALAAAGDFGPLGWPSNSVLIRRIGENQELRIPLDLDLIMNGKEPDIFLKPNDVVAVGSHVAAPFLAVMRNAFRLTYGFGFIYDRNFAEANFGQFREIDSFFR